MRATKEILTDKSIKSLPTPAAENRSTVYDGIVPGLMVRVTDQGHKSFCLAARFPLNPKNPTRRLLGKVGVLTLAESRDKARAWLLLISKEIDSKVEDERIKAEAERRQDTTFGAVAADFLDRHVVNLAKAKKVRAIIGGEFIKRWKNRPIEYVMPMDISQAVRAIAGRGAAAQAHNAIGAVRIG